MDCWDLFIRRLKDPPVRFDARCWVLGAGALGRPRGGVWGRGVQNGERVCASGGFVLMFGKTNTIM